MKNKTKNNNVPKRKIKRNEKYSVAPAKETKETNKTKSSNNKSIKNNQEDEEDWISKLVQQTQTYKPNSTKEARIQKRQLKKKQKHNFQNNVKIKNHIANQERKYVQIENSFNHIPLKLSKYSYTNLTILNSYLRTIDLSSNKKNKPIALQEKKGKAMKDSSFKETQIQPSHVNYNGMGVAKPSVFCSLQDVSFRPKYTNLFQEHIEGFNGNLKYSQQNKYYTHNQSSKEQDDMLWKVLLHKKRNK